MSVVRWQFEEMSTGATHTVEVNPNKMSGYLPTKALAFTSRLDASGRVAGVREPSRPKEWTFEGVVFTETHHDALAAWAKKPGKVQITDHLGRVFEVMVQSIAMIDRRATALNSWRFTYTFNSLLLRRIT